MNAAAACVILVSFAAGHRQAYWNGRIKSAIAICHEIFSNLALAIFLFKIIFTSVSKPFFVLEPRSGFGARISSAFARSSNVFCKSIPADRIVVAVLRLLGATPACVILVSFAAGHGKS